MGLLRLYPAPEREFLSNGLGALPDITDSAVTEELNSAYELSLTYPVTGLRFGELKTGRIITAQPGPGREAEPFRITRITKPLDGLVDVLCRHVAYDLGKVTVSPFAAASAQEAVTGLTEGAAFGHPFALSCEVEKNGAFVIQKPADLWTAMGTKKGGIVAVYGGEWEFSRFSAALKKERGGRRDVTVRYGKNLTGFEQEEDLTDTVTGIHPYWAGKKNYCLELPEKVIWLSDNRELDRVMPVDLSDKLEAYPTEEQLRQAALDYIAREGLDRPRISWAIQWVQLSRTLDYWGTDRFDRVALGDWVQVYHPDYGAALDARVVRTVYKPHLERYEVIGLGSSRRSPGRTMAGIRRQAVQAWEAAKQAEATNG